MADLDHWWGGDLVLDARGDLLAVEGAVRGEQRILRRLCTKGGRTGAQIAEYLFHEDYGGSLPWYVGRPTAAVLLEGLIRAQMYREAAVGHAPEPQIDTTSLPTGLLSVTIRYADRPTGATRTLSFDVTG